MRPLWYKLTKLGQPVFIRSLDTKHQLNNIIDTDQQCAADYPELVNNPSIGYKEVVLVCGT